MIRPKRIPRPHDEVSVRMTRVSDAQALIDHANAVSGESDNLTFGPGEFDMTLEKQQAFLKSIRNSSHALYLVATCESNIIGALTFQSGKRPRTSHEGEFGLSVRKRFWGRGIGRRLLSRLLSWASRHGITKINLRVRVDNPRAIQLYLRHGFEFEGRLRRSFFVQGRYHDTYAMGICL